MMNVRLDRFNIKWSIIIALISAVGVCGSALKTLSITQIIVIFFIAFFSILIACYICMDLNEKRVRKEIEDDILTKIEVDMDTKANLREKLIDVFNNHKSFGELAIIDDPMKLCFIFTDDSKEFLVLSFKELKCLPQSIQKFFLVANKNANDIVSSLHEFIGEKYE